MPDSNLEERTNGLDWMSAEHMRSTGHIAHGPEIDYGMRWGANHEVRVSFAPLDAEGHGFLYVFDARRNQYAVLAESTSFAEVDAAWRALSDEPIKKDDYVLMADMIAAPEHVKDARSLWWHCVEQEMIARQHHESVGSDPTVRFEAARAAVIARSARTASEDLLEQSLSGIGHSFGAPAVVRYRVLGRDGWTGRAVGADLHDAAAAASELQDLAGRYGFTIQATSLRHGNVVLAAARVPELHAVAKTARDLGADPAFTL